MNLNRVCISGNITRAPELRRAANGTGVLSIGVAINESRKDKESGEYVNYPVFVNTVVFGARADALAPKLSKGMKVSIDGKLRMNSWEDKNGMKHETLEVVIDDIDFQHVAKD